MKNTLTKLNRTFASLALLMSVAAAQTRGNTLDAGGRGGGRGGRGIPGGSSGTPFEVAVPAHSFRVFQAETNSP